MQMLLNKSPHSACQYVSFIQCFAKAMKALNDEQPFNCNGDSYHANSTYFRLRVRQLASKIRNLVNESNAWESLEKKLNSSQRDTFIQLARVLCPGFMTEPATQPAQPQQMVGPRVEGHVSNVVLSRPAPHKDYVEEDVQVVTKDEPNLKMVPWALFTQTMSIFCAHLGLLSAVVPHCVFDWSVAGRVCNLLSGW